MPLTSKPKLSKAVYLEKDPFGSSVDRDVANKY